jgi:hypothetical protein
MVVLPDFSIEYYVGGYNTAGPASLHAAEAQATEIGRTNKRIGQQINPLRFFLKEIRAVQSKACMKKILTPFQ